MRVASCVAESSGGPDELLQLASGVDASPTVNPMPPRTRHRRPERIAWVCMRADSTATMTGMANVRRLSAWSSSPVAWAGTFVVLAACVPSSDAEPPRFAPPSRPTATADDGWTDPRGDAPSERAEVQTGLATWYGAAFAGRRTANGERFDPARLTAAHRTLPFGTVVDVTRVDTRATVRVRITDRGPFGHEDRIIDLSRAAAERIGLVRTGVARVELHVVGAQ
jgi:rare lipoprotein A